MQTQRKILAYVLSLALAWTLVLAGNVLASQDAARAALDTSPISHADIGHGADSGGKTNQHHHHGDHAKTEKSPSPSPVDDCIAECLENATIIDVVTKASPTPRTFDKFLFAPVVEERSLTSAHMVMRGAAWPSGPPIFYLTRKSDERLIRVTARLRL